MSEAPVTESEAEETMAEESKAGEETEATTAVIRQRRPDKPVIAPFLYTTMLN